MRPRTCWGRPSVGHLLVQGARFRDNGASHQQRGVYVASVTGSVTFEDSFGPIQSMIVTGNEEDGVVIADGGTKATFTNGTYDNNTGEGASEGDGVRLNSFSGSVTFSGVAVGDLTADGNADDGIDLTDVGPVSFTNVWALSNGDNGAEVATAASLSDTSGRYTGNGTDGIQGSSIGAVSLNETTASNNTDDGVDLDVIASFVATGTAADQNNDDGPVRVERGGDGDDHE